MKKLRLLGLILTFCLCFAIALPAWAADDDTLGSKVDGLGYLVSVERNDFDDGSYCIERTYVAHPISYYAATSGTDTFTKTAESRLGTGSVLVKYQIKATFDWNSSTKTVNVYNAVGEITYNQGGANSPITNESTTTSGNNTKKAKATYSFTRTTNLGFSNNYSVSVACNYNGQQS